MELKDKIAGALYGMALGDAMGMPAELWGRERARSSSEEDHRIYRRTEGK